jgi:O-antigen/teichoic acid export membrane protein
MNLMINETIIEKIVKVALQAKLSLGGNRRRLVDLGLLYISKSGSVLVGLLILPFFNRQLGPDLFGFVALILSLQAFLLLLDFGMATMVGRDLAVAETTELQRYATWRAAEWAISLLYLALAPIALIASWLWGGTLSSLEILSCAVLFWALTLQNIGQSALLARHQFAVAAVLQIAGLLMRHGLTAFSLLWIAPTLACFIATQSAVAVVQMLLTRRRCVLELQPSSPERVQVDVHKRAIFLMRTGRSLMLFGLAGAAVMQFDKIIVSGLMSPRELGPYFLATTFCMTPISVLAGPVAQFFQPRLVNAISSADLAATQRTIKHFIGSLAVCALVPAGLLWLMREPLISLWLHDAAEMKRVVQYSAVLLPGVAIGALGYVPYSLLIAKQDYGFQARLSVALTVVTLIATFIAVLQSSILAVCAFYALYHSISTVSSWLRCILQNAGGASIAAVGARYAAFLVFLVFIFTIFMAVIAAKFNFL